MRLILKNACVYFLGFIFYFSSLRCDFRMQSSVSAATTTNEFGSLEVLRLDAFPKDKVAMHFSCEESNMFATNCACHLRCTESACHNAKRLCVKYANIGCKYVLTRGPPSNQIATLKRTPTQSELARFNISNYPLSRKSLTISPWVEMQAAINAAKGLDSGPTLRDLATQAGAKGEKTLVALQNSVENNLCVGDQAHANSSWRKAFTSGSISLVALNYRTPKSLVNSLRTWNSSGLLAMMRDKTIILNDPLPQEIAMSLEHGFRVIEPKDISGVKLSKPNVVTIGAAFYYALTMQPTMADYLLFLESDFKMDINLKLEDIRAELVAAAGMLDRGAQVVRLMSRKLQGCGTFKSCEHGGINLKTQNGNDRKRNWLVCLCLYLFLFVIIFSLNFPLLFHSPLKSIISHPTLQ